jgi:hypothetical protein
LKKHALCFVVIITGRLSLLNCIIKNTATVNNSSSDLTNSSNGTPNMDTTESTVSSLSPIISASHSHATLAERLESLARYIEVTKHMQTRRKKTVLVHSVAVPESLKRRAESLKTDPKRRKAI